VNPDTIGYVWTGELDLNTLRVDGKIFESGKKSCGFKNIRIRVDEAKNAVVTFLSYWNEVKPEDERVRNTESLEIMNF